MAVIDDLTRGENRRGEFHAIDDRVEAAFQQLDQDFAVVALAAHGFLVIAAELTFADIAVIAAQFLLGHQLHAVIGWLGATLAMLAGAIIALVERAFRTAPEIDTQAAVDFMLRFKTFGHR